MSVVQPLLELQEIDGRIRELQAEAHGIPPRKREEEKQLDGAREALERTRSELQDAKVRINQIELEAQGHRDKILALKKNQALLKTNKEFHIYNLEIAKLEGCIDGCDERAIVAMDDLDPIARRIAEAERELETQTRSVERSIVEMDARLEVVTAELAEQEQLRSQAARKVDPRSLLYYERMRTKRWPVVVILQIEEGVCTGCNMVQPPSVGQMVRRKQGLVPCQMCGRILYNDGH